MITRVTGNPGGNLDTSRDLLGFRTIGSADPSLVLVERDEVQGYFVLERFFYSRLGLDLPTGDYELRQAPQGNVLRIAGIGLKECSSLALPKMMGERIPRASSDGIDLIACFLSKRGERYSCARKLLEECLPESLRFEPLRLPRPTQFYASPPVVENDDTSILVRYLH